MAARWLEQKYNKLKQGRRKAYLKNPKSGGVDVSKIFSYDIYNNRQRVRTTTGSVDRDGTEPILDNAFVRQIPKTLWEAFQKTRPRKARWDGNELEFAKFVSDHLKTNPFSTNREIFDAWLSHPRDGLKASKEEIAIEKSRRERRSFLLDTLHEVWQGRYRQGVAKYQEVTLKRAGEDSLIMYFSGNEWLFVLTVGDTRWISKTYYEREEAVSAHERNRVTWIIEEPVVTS